MAKSSICLFVLGICVAVFAISSCESKKEKKHDKKEKEKEKEVKDLPVEKKKIEATSTGDCDTTLYWKYVYNPERLTVIEKCKTVTGVIEESNADDDGDEHMLLKLDDGQKELLTKMNKKKKQGDLVIEAVCANKVKLKKVSSTCEGYINKIQIPALGTHVRVTGSLVNDSHNGWNEIHPITSLEVIK